MSAIAAEEVLKRWLPIISPLIRLSAGVPFAKDLEFRMDPTPIFFSVIPNSRLRKEQSPYGIPREAHWRWTCSNHSVPKWKFRQTFHTNFLPPDFEKYSKEALENAGFLLKQTILLSDFNSKASWQSSRKRHTWSHPCGTNLKHSLKMFRARSAVEAD